MRTGKANVVAPLTSPEEPPATSCAAVSFSSPVCLSDRRAPLVSRRVQAGAGPGLRRVWATLASLARVCGPPFLRAGPPVVE